jgi:hypothetical protein
LGNQSRKAVGRTVIRLPVDGLLSSGDRALHSGLYRIEHERHDAKGEVYIRKGTEMPVCRDCGEAINFRLIEKIPHIGEDPDFSLSE